MTDAIFRITHGPGPLVATAIHAGHSVRPEVLRQMAIGEADRLREEDPYTDAWTFVAPTRVVGLGSRFEVDLNRPRDKAIYQTPEDAWGLQVWQEQLSAPQTQRSLFAYDHFYQELEALYRELAARQGAFCVLDLHSYNHRRQGPGGPAADPQQNPEVNVGTGTLRERHRWASLVRRFMDELAAFELPGGHHLDVRENVRFRGGACASWTHDTFPGQACVLSIEVKKFFMDEWTGVPAPGALWAVGEALASTVPGLLLELGRV